jgi:hypothetical protein
MRHFELEINHPKRVSSHTMGGKAVKRGEREIEDKRHGIQVQITKDWKTKYLG